MITQLITDPTIEPVSLEELKLHLKIELDVLDEDEYLEGLEKTARRHLENITRRALLTQTWDYFLDGWPAGDFIKLPFGNLQDVPLTQYIKWKDETALSTTLTVTTDYIWETNGDRCGRVVLPYSVTWPNGTLYPSNPIVIRFVCGWTTAELVPYEIKAAITRFVAKIYESRGEDILRQTVSEDKVVELLVGSMRLWDHCL